jgi:hypothetical protein
MAKKNTLTYNYVYHAYNNGCSGFYAHRLRGC